MSANYSPMLTALARAANARRILEIGGGPDGASGRAFAEAMGEGGELWTIDIEAGHPPEKVRWGAEALYKLKWWKHLVGDSLRVEVPVDSVDLLYIDGDHGFDHAIGDFRRFSPLVRESGLVIFDDFPILNGVTNAVQQVLHEGEWDGLALPYNHEDGNSHYVLRRKLSCPL